MWWVPDVKHTLVILPEHLLLCVMFFGVDYFWLNCWSCVFYHVLVIAAFHIKFFIFDWFINCCLMSYSRREQIQLTYQREKIQRDKTKLCLRRTTKTYLKKLGRNDLFKSYLQIPVILQARGMDCCPALEQFIFPV